MNSRPVDTCNSEPDIRRNQLLARIYALLLSQVVPSERMYEPMHKSADGDEFGDQTPPAPESTSQEKGDSDVIL